MMTFDKTSKGIAFAQIFGGKDDKKIIYLVRKDGDFKELKLEDDSHFEIIPNPNTERENLYFTGPGGAGKSRKASFFIEKWIKKIGKNKDIYLFSAKEEDPALDRFDPIRVPIDHSLLEQKITHKDFQKGDFIIFDDVDSIKDKKVKDETYKIIADVLNVGRSYNLWVIVTNHLPTDRDRTKQILNECHLAFWFPFSGGKQQINYMLKTYIGLDPVTIAKVKKTKSDWACAYCRFPTTICTEKECWIADIDEDE